MRSIAGHILRFIRFTLFTILMMFRGLILWIARVFGGLLFVTGIIVLIVGSVEPDVGDVTAPGLTALIVGLGLSMLTYGYDRLLLALQPEGTDTILIQ